MIDRGEARETAFDDLFDDHVGLGEALLDVTETELHALGDVRRLGRLRLNAGGEQVVVQHRRVVGHGLVDGQHVRQDLVGDDNGVGRRIGLLTGGGSHAGHHMALVEHLVAGDGVGGHVE